MKPKPIHFAILLALLTGLVVNNSPIQAGLTVPACADLSGSSTATVKLGGKVVAPGSLVRVPAGGTCLPNEVQVGFNGYARTILVSPVVTPTDNGTALLAAMNTATSGYLIKLEPGSYDLGNNQLIMKQGVDLEGSGQDQTIITAQLNDPFQINKSSTVVLTKTSEIRFLTLTTNSPYAPAVVESGGFSDLSAVLNNVTISATTSTGSKYGINGASATIKNSTIIIQCTNTGNCYGINNPRGMTIESTNIVVQANGSGTAYGVKISGSNAEISGGLVYVTGNNGASSYGISSEPFSNVEIRNVKITLGCSANCAAIINNNVGPIIVNPYIRVSADFIFGSSGLQSYGISNTNGGGGTIEGGMIIMYSGGGNSSYAIANSGGSPVIQNMQIYNSAIDNSKAYGIYNNGGSSEILNTKILAGAQSAGAYGIYNTGGATPKIQNSKITVGGPPAYAIYNTGGAGATILNSSLENLSSVTSIFNDPGATAKVAGSQINGVVSGPGISCLYSYKPDLTPLGAGCS